MKSIAYIVPYFGKFPDLFPIWLHSCGNNPTIDWIVFTDDRRAFNYPPNVHVHYLSFNKMREMVQDKLECNFYLDKPYKLCDFRIAYGEIFGDYLKIYDFWGFCDIDLIWGNIRNFLTDEVLSKFDKIGFQGHSTLIRNTEFYNKLYKHGLKDGTTFEQLIQSPESMFADEAYFNKLFAELDIDFYQEFTFANLSPFVYNFRLNYLPVEWNDRNKHFIFEYKQGILTRVSLVGNELINDEYMYIHFLKREMNVCIDAEDDYYLIVPNKLVPYQILKSQQVKEFNKPHYLRFFISHFKENAYKLNYKTVFPIIWRKLRGYYRLFFNTNQVRY